MINQNFTEIRDPTKICEYGCGQPANYQLLNGKWCCSKTWQSCKKIKEKNSKSQIGKQLSIEHKKKIGNNSRGRIKSAEEIKKISNSNKGKNVTTETRKKIGDSSRGRKHTQKTKDIISKKNKGMIPWNKGKQGYLTKPQLKNMSISNLLTIEKIKEKYPLFAKVEEMRYNPDKPSEKEIQVHCKNHLCKNSKEQGGWFTPERVRLQSRIYSLEKKDGNEGRYLYCSDECINVCPLYNLHPNYILAQNNSKIVYTDSEYQIFKKEVLKRQKEEIGKNVCEICGSDKDLQVHHIIPQKIEPYFSLDPDNGVILCGNKSNNCHNKYGHKDECSYGKLSTLYCKPKGE